MQIADIRERLASLDDNHLDTLLVVALEGHSAWSRTAWQAKVGDAGIVDDRGRKLAGEAFKAIVERLAAIGATTCGDRGEYYTVTQSWLVPLIALGAERGRLATLAPLLRSASRGSWREKQMSPHGELLAALASNDATGVKRALPSVRDHERWSGQAHRTNGILRAIGMEVPSAWLELIEPTERQEYLREAVVRAFVEAARVSESVLDAAASGSDVEAKAHAAMLLALAGNAKRAHEVLDANPPVAANAQWTRGARAFVVLTERRFEDARAAFAGAAVGARGQRVDLPGALSVFDCLLAATSDRAEEVADLARRVDKGRRHLAPFPMATDAVVLLTSYRRSGTATPLPRYRAGDWIDRLVAALVERWMGSDPVERPVLESLSAQARERGYPWLGDELARVAAGEKEDSLLAVFGSKEGWELTLESLRVAIERAAPVRPAASNRPTENQIWWTLDLDDDRIEVEANAVSKRATKGKRLSIDRILQEAAGARESSGIVIDEEDRRAAQAVVTMKARHYYLPVSVLSAFVGHPRVRDESGKRLVVEACEPKLHIDTTANGTRIRLVPSDFGDSGVAVTREADRIIVCSRSVVAARILEILPPEGIVVPAKGQALLSELVGAVGGAIAVEATSAVAEEKIAGDARVHVQLFRGSSALRARLRVQPGGASGPALRPGAPPAESVVHTEAGLVRVARDLAAERASVDALLERCPTLASLPQEGDDRIAPDLESCLELLFELREAAALVEWREGQPLRAPAARDASALRVQVSGSSTWLTIEGEVKVDDGRVLAMRELLEHASRATGRFIPIGDDEFLALTEDLMKRLGALGRLANLSSGGKLSSALLPAVTAICDGLDVSFSAQVAKKREALERTQTLEVRTPRGLETELRDYQRDGFLFLARRSEAGLGACLADDMGLGKTVQALALLLHRRKAGPALVVAPTSVCRNWESEAARFAPALSIKRLGAGDREACVASAQAGDIVITSYGLLAAAGELLASRRWSTVIFDEAHALKNATTKRWSAARELKSDAIVALTGTPVENHARELHALFDLLVPGMLGSRAAFERVLGAPIAEGNREAATLLRNLVRPFVLRRTKSEVLSELPPKTEVLHVVPPTTEHLAFYEAVRRRAVESIKAAQKTRGAQAGRARIDILAEIMRLRRAAIDPRLVGGEDAPAGGKIEALVELARELRAEGRRALVFSQFLEVLDFARAGLESAGMECLRLDGTMSEAARAEQVAWFQGGRGDMFLVSLKAGGVGMNLTGADVVILLDPWWNPAVEDQAAGRAHRIGQTRPVTVLRIVTERTIEEKVLALHAKKRRLYEDVVSEADGAGALDVDAIVALLEDIAPKTAPSAAPAQGI